MAPVGDRSHHVGHLQRGAAQLALPDRQRDHGQSVPSAPVGLVVKFGGGDVPVQFAGKVRSEFAAVPETANIVRPHAETFLDVFVFFVFDDIPENVAEVGVAGVRDGCLQVERRSVRVAFDAAPVRVSSVTGIGLRRRQHALLHSNESLDHFER